MGEKGSFYKAKELILAPSLFSFRSCGQCLRVCVCVCVCACVRERVTVCVFALPHGLHAGRGELLCSSLRQSTAAGGHRRRLSLRCHHPHRCAMCGLPEVSCTHKHICSCIKCSDCLPSLVGWLIGVSYSACLNPKPKIHNSSCFCVVEIIP